MQLIALFALLPLLAHAAPLGLPIVGGGLPAVGSVPAVGSLPAVGGGLPAVPAVPSSIPKPSDIIAGATGNAGAGGAVVVGALGGAIPAPVKSIVGTAVNKVPVVSSTLSAVIAAATGGNVLSVAGSAVAQASAVVQGSVDKGLHAAEGNGLSIGINSAVITASGTGSAAVAPITTATPSDLITKLQYYIVGLRPISVTDALTQLTYFDNNLETALKNEIATLKANVDYKAALRFVAQLVANLNAYLVAFPKTLAADAQVIAISGKIDQLLASYLTAIKIVGLSSTDFANDLYVFNVHEISVLLPLLASATHIVPAPTFTAGL